MNRRPCDSARARRSAPDGPIDLRSDTVTRPTKQMRAAMAAAEVGDDVLDRDPTMRELETRVAGLLGTDDALWTPERVDGQPHRADEPPAAAATRSSPRPARTCSTPSWARRRGWPAACRGRCRTTPGPGKVSPDAVRRAAGSPGPYYTLRTTLLCLENTHNAAGGTVTAPEEHAAVAAAARAAQLRVHLDGARLWHAAVALGVPPAR